MCRFLPFITQNHNQKDKLCSFHLIVKQTGLSITWTRKLLNRSCNIKSHDDVLEDMLQRWNNSTHNEIHTYRSPFPINTTEHRSSLQVWLLSEPRLRKYSLFLSFFLFLYSGPNTRPDCPDLARSHSADSKTSIADSPWVLGSTSESISLLSSPCSRWDYSVLALLLVAQVPLQLFSFPSESTSELF